MARYHSIGTIKRDLREKYMYKGKANFDECARIIWQFYRELLQTDVSGCYRRAFQMAEREGLIIKKQANNLEKIAEQLTLF